MRGLTAAMIVGALALALAVPAEAHERDDTIGALSESAYAASIVPLDPRITVLDRTISQVERTVPEGDTMVVVLSSDILFEFGKAEISAAAETKIQELVADIPAGGTVRVHGHTDSIGEDDRNQQLSQDRAATVAQVAEKARPDLSFDVEGFGETDPVEPNEEGGDDNPEGRALNRRVEIRYDR